MAEKGEKNGLWCLLRRGLLGAGILLVVAAAGFVVWASFPAPPGETARAALVSSSEVRGGGGRLPVFPPCRGSTRTGLIFYPGGRVSHRAYAPLARAAAEEGYLVVVPEMPLNLAVFGVGRAGEVIAENPGVTAWAVGGHSLGGAMAAQYAANHPHQVQGLLLLASYPAENTDLSDLDLEVVSIYGTRDGLASVEEVLTSAERLPEEARFVEIAGGNHAGFGDYGSQRGDRQAAISQQEQREEVIQAALQLLASLRR